MASSLPVSLNSEGLECHVSLPSHSPQRGAHQGGPLPTHPCGHQPSVVHPRPTQPTHPPASWPLSACPLQALSPGAQLPAVASDKGRTV